MQTIHKFLINENGSAKMPADAEILKVAFQKKSLWLWALVDSRAPEVERLFHVVPTGGIAVDCSKHNYVGTAVSDDWVFHIFRGEG